MNQRSPGWDAQAIKQVVADYHDGKLANLFEAHGWPERGAAMMPAQQGRIASLYGSIEEFVHSYANGAEGNFILNPKAAISGEAPDVWLTSFYGFTPWNWAFLGFTAEWMRRRFLRESAPGSLLVIYGAGGAPDPSEKGKLLGLQQHSREIGLKWDFLSADRAVTERADADRANRWLYAVRTIRAWQVPPESRPRIEDFAPQTFNPGNARAIGSMGLKLSPAEARGVLSLNLIEVPVLGGEPVEALIPGPAERVLSPSRPGPVAQSSYIVREAEGPKHLYILRLDGGAKRLLDDASDDELIIKVGLSGSPSTRRDAHNGALPSCMVSWIIERSTAEENRRPFSTSRHALAGEWAMKTLLAAEGRSLGGEFFLASRAAIDRAWSKAIAAAESCKP